MTTRMLQRRDLASAWAAVNPILGDGEIGFVKDTGEIKIGNGVDHFEDLLNPYLTLARIRSGEFVLVKGDVGLSNVDNTSDVNKPVSTAQATAIATKVAKAGDSMTGTLNINTTIVTNQAAVLQGVSGQTADLFQTKDYLGNKLVTISASGILRIWNNHLVFDNTYGSLFNLTSGNQAYIQGNGTQLKLRGGTGGLVVRNNADTVNLFALDDSGGIFTSGTNSGYTANDRDGTARGYIHYVNANIWRLYSTTASRDVLSVDAVNGTLSSWGNLELGRQDGVASTPFIDFHAAASVIDYDVRLLVSNPQGASGKATLTVSAGQLFISAGNVANTPLLVLSGNPANRGTDLKFNDTGTAGQDKYLRINSGKFQILNNAYTVTLLDVDDSGVITQVNTNKISNAGTQGLLSVAYNGAGADNDNYGIVGITAPASVNRAYYSMTAAGNAVFGIGIGSDNIMRLGAVVTGKAMGANVVKIDASGSLSTPTSGQLFEGPNRVYSAANPPPGGSSLSNDKGHLASNFSVTNSALTVFTTASLGVGTWILTASALYSPGAAARKVSWWIAQGTGTATFDGSAGAEMTVPINGAEQVVFSAIVTVTVAGTFLLRAVADTTGGQFLASLSNIAVPSATGYTAVKIA